MAILTQKIGGCSPQERGPLFIEKGDAPAPPYHSKGFIFDRLSLMKGFTF